MWVCSNATRPGIAPSAAYGANAAASESFQPSASSVSTLGHLTSFVVSTHGRAGFRPRRDLRPTGLQQDAQHFGDAPGLRDAPARHERRLGIEDLADRSDTRVAQVAVETVEYPACAVAVLWIHLQPRVDERPDQPRPHRALVVG